MNAKSHVFLTPILVGFFLIGLATRSVAVSNCTTPPDSLALWLPLDWDAQDVTNGGEVVLSGSPVFVNAQVSAGLRFDGVDDAVRVPASSALDVGAGSGATLELWVRPDQVNSPMALFEWTASGGSQLGLHFYTSVNGSGSLWANLVDTSGASHTFASTSGVLSPGADQHVALTYDRSSGVARFFVNGTKVAESTLGNFRLETRVDLWLGRRVLGGSPFRFSGVMDEVSVYNRALSPEEVQAIVQSGASGKCRTPVAPQIVTQPASQTVLVGENAFFTVLALGTSPLSFQWHLGDQAVSGATNKALILSSATTNDAGSYSVIVQNAAGSVTSSVATLTVNLAPTCLPPPSGLVAWWPFDEGGGDLVGAVSATFTGGPAFVPGKVGGALWLDGSDDTAAVPASAQLNVGTADGFTIEGWIHPASSGQQPLVEWNNRAGLAGAHLWLGVNSPGSLYANLVDMNDGYHLISTVGGLVSTGVWQHVALTYKKSTGLTTIYVNGGSVVQQILGSFSAQTAPPFDLLLGHRIAFGGVQYRYKGGMDEMSLYARALSASEIESIYSATASGKCKSGFPPQIGVGPLSRTVVRGSTVVFNISASGTAPLAYQWLFNDTPIAGATSSSLTLPDVQINQSGNYSVVVTNAIGNAVSSPAVLTVNPPPATVRVVSANGAAGAEVSVPVELVANGNENALGFSLSFNSSVLGFASADLGVGAPEGATLFVNTNEAAAGRLGLVVGLPSDHVFPEGTQRVALVTFFIAPILNQTNVSVNLVDQPTLRQLSDIHAQVLPSVFVGGTVSVADSQFEADVAPRPNGNRSIATIDWVQMGRFVARLDPISGSNEFQRADCAPRMTKGNGLLTASDWVQVGRYAVGLDPLTVLGGPTEPAEDGGGGFAPAAAPRLLSVMNTSIAQGQTAFVPLTLESQGNENAMSFSIIFDPLKLGFLGATTGSGTVGALLNLNIDAIASGRLGVALAMQPGAALSVGMREVLLLRFAALAVAPTTTTISFTNAPVPSEVSDVQANALVTSYAPASISVTPPPGPPLRISRSGSSVIIRWPTSPSGFDLETSARVSGTAWSLVPGVLDAGDEKLAIMSITEGERYFRLKKP